MFSFVTYESWIRRETARREKFLACRRGPCFLAGMHITHTVSQSFPIVASTLARAGFRSRSSIVQWDPSEIAGKSPLWPWPTASRGKHCSYWDEPFAVKRRRTTMYAKRQSANQHRARDEQWSSGIRTDMHKSSIWRRLIVAELSRRDPMRCDAAST